MPSAMRRLAVIAILAILPLALNAGQGPRILETADDGRGLEGVGRLDLAQAGFCTAALVSPTHVLTAAHCVFDPVSRTPIKVEALTFRAGLRFGREDARRRVRRVAIHPDYEYRTELTRKSVSTDLALLELDRALDLPNIQPFMAAGRLSEGDVVQVVSYARERAHAPAIEDDCVVLARERSVLALSCKVNFGASGSPVFTRTPEGLQIVSVISAMGTWNDQDVAFAVTVEAGLDELTAQLSKTPKAPPVRKTLRVGEGAAQDSTIRFLRP